MGGILQPILALLLVFIREDGASAGGPCDAAGVLWFLLVWLALVVWSTRWALRLFRKACREGDFRPPGRLSLLHFAGFALLLWVTDWAPLVLTRVTAWPGLSTLLIFLPYVVAQALRAWVAYEGLAPGRKGPGRRMAVTIFQVRLLALPVLPLVLINAMRRLLMLQEQMGRLMEAYVPVFMAVLLGTVFVVFGLAPLFLRFTLGARPLGRGPLLDRLRAYGRKVNYVPTNILVWDTGETVSNALFIGILPILRYVLLTDRLIKELDEREIEAIFAHETGHGQRHHTQLYLLFAAGFTLLSMLLQEEGLPLLDGFSGLFANTLLVIFNLASLVLFFGVFGWLSRRFESEADIFAMATLDHPDLFPKALKRVGLHAGGARGKRGGFSHFGIGTRVGLLARYWHEPEFRASFQSLLKNCRMAILALVLAGGGLLAWRTPDLIKEGRLRMGALLVQDAYLKQDPRLARQALASLESLTEDPRLGREARRQAEDSLWILGRRAVKRGRFDEARQILNKMRGIGSRSYAVGAFNCALLAVLLNGVEGRLKLRDVRQARQRLDALLKGGPPLEPTGVFEDSGDLWLAARAAGDKRLPPRHPQHLPPAARLLWMLESGRGGNKGAQGLLSCLALAAERDGAARRALFRRATGGLSPRRAGQLGRREKP